MRSRNSYFLGSGCNHENVNRLQRTASREVHLSTQAGAPPLELERAGRGVASAWADRGAGARAGAASANLVALRPLAMPSNSAKLEKGYKAWVWDKSDETYYSLGTIVAVRTDENGDKVVDVDVPDSNTPNCKHYPNLKADGSGKRVWLPHPIDNKLPLSEQTCDDHTGARSPAARIALRPCEAHAHAHDHAPRQHPPPGAPC